MAERRMFAKTIIDSDAFLDMPPTARLLYYDLGMRADDDGFVNGPKKIMRVISASEDDLKLLIAKKFIIPFENGVVVIKHWRIHNYIRKDTYKATNYKEQLATLEYDENNAYTQAMPTLTTVRDESVDGTSTQVRLGKDRLGKVSIEDIYRQRFDEFWQLYPKKVGKADARKSWLKIKPTEELHGQIINKVSAYKQSDLWKEQNGRFIPNPATWLNQGRWEDEIYKQPSSNPFKEYYRKELLSEQERNNLSNGDHQDLLPRILPPGCGD